MIQCPCCPQCLLTYFNNNTAYLLKKKPPSIVNSSHLWIPIWKSLSALMVSLICRTDCVDSGKYLPTWLTVKKKNAAINRICLYFYSASHTYPLLILRDNFLRDNYSFTAVGEFNSVVPFLYHISPPFLLGYFIIKWESQSGASLYSLCQHPCAWQAGWLVLVRAWVFWHPSQSGQPVPARRLLVLSNIVTLWWIAQCGVLATLE